MWGPLKQEVVLFGGVGERKDETLYFADENFKLYI